MVRKIFLIIFLLAAAGLAYYAYPIIKNRYFGTGTETIAPTPAEEEQDRQLPENNGTSEQAEDEEIISEENQETLKQEGKVFQKVTGDDCDAECTGLSGTDLEYCQEVCGLKPIRENVSDCGNLSDLQKDYCLKDLAVSKKDFKICEEIKDDNIKTTCKNRIAEELLEESRLEE
jgi:hypothetical protein